MRLTIKEAWAVLDQLLQLISTVHHKEIRRVTIQNDIPDKLMFKASTNGAFSTKIYTDIIRNPLPKRRWPSRVWLNFLPPKIMTFLWKLMRHAIPVDTRIVSNGVQLASKCRCCSEVAEESIMHLFIHSEIAKAVWTCFDSIFRVPPTPRSIAYILHTWLPKPGRWSQFDCCKGGVAATILWEIWVARCSATLKDAQ